MKEINIGQATALTSPDPLVLVCTKKEDGKLRRDEENHNHGADKMEGLLHNGDQAAGDKIPDGLYVASETGHDLADAVMVVKAEGQLVQVLEQRLPDGKNHVL